MLSRVLGALRRLDDAAETVIFEAGPRLVRQSGVPLGFAVLALLTAGIYREAPAPVAAPAAPAAVREITPDAGVFLLERPWCDNPAAGPRDRFSMWFFSDRPAGDRGLWSIFHTGVPAKASYEMFVLRPGDRALKLTSLFDQRGLSVPYRVTRERRGKCDLKLTLESDPHFGGRRHEYWSRVDRWQGRDDAPVVAVPLPLN